MSSVPLTVHFGPIENRACSTASEVCEVPESKPTPFNWYRRTREPSTLVGRALKQLSKTLGESLPEERRRHVRLPTHGTITVLLPGEDESDALTPTAAHLLDISPGGMALRTKTLVPVGSSVSLSDGRTILNGVVRRVTPDGKEFALGVEIVGGAASEHESQIRLLA